MVSSDKKYRRRRIALILGIILPVLCYAGYVFSVNLNIYNNLKEQKVVAEQNLEQIQQENEQLHQEVEYTKTDDFIVQKARELFDRQADSVSDIAYAVGYKSLSCFTVTH